LVAFKLTSSQDRDAIGAWVEGSADKQQWREIWASLPTMQRGQGVLWAPARGVLSTVKFPEKLTFDSSRTPKRGESKRTTTLKPINLDKLQERLSAVKAEVDANDPKALRAEITRLKAELAKKPAGAVETDAAAIAAAEQRGFQRGFKDGFEDANAQARQSLDVHRNLIGESIKNFCASATHTLSVLTLDLQIPNDIESGSPTGRTVPAPTRPPVVPPAARSSSPAASGDGNLAGPQQRILNSLATWARMGERQPNNAQVAWLAGYSPSSTSYTNPRSALKTAGLIEYPSPDRLSITSDGQAAARPFTDDWARSPHDICGPAA
jgi:hypothetical protein